MQNGPGAVFDFHIKQTRARGDFAKLRRKVFVGMTDYFHAHRLEKMRGQVKITRYWTGHPNERLKATQDIPKDFSLVFICAYLFPSVNGKNPIIAALDVTTAEAAMNIAEEIAPAAGGFKIGKELFVSAGPDIVKKIRATGASVFLDLKFHDIPNTVAKAIAAAIRLDVQMLTIHTSGGGEMMRAAEKSAQSTATAPGSTA